MMHFQIDMDGALACAVEMPLADVLPGDVIEHANPAMVTSTANSSKPPVHSGLWFVERLNIDNDMVSLEMTPFLCPGPQDKVILPVFLSVSSYSSGQMKYRVWRNATLTLKLTP